MKWCLLFIIDMLIVLFVPERLRCASVLWGGWLSPASPLDTPFTSCRPQLATHIHHKHQLDNKEEQRRTLSLRSNCFSFVQMYLAQEIREAVWF